MAADAARDSTSSCGEAATSIPMFLRRCGTVRFAWRFLFRLGNFRLFDQRRGPLVGQQLGFPRGIGQRHGTLRMNAARRIRSLTAHGAGLAGAFRNHGGRLFLVHRAAHFLPRFLHRDPVSRSWARFTACSRPHQQSRRASATRGLCRCNYCISTGEEEQPARPTGESAAD